MSDSGYGVRVATSKGGNAYIAGLYGPKGVAQKLRAMGLESKIFSSWQKKAALIVAARATSLAPVDSGRLAFSIRGYASKKITQNNQPARQVYGGVVIAQPKVRGQSRTYAKKISFGSYNFRTGVRTKGNPYIRTARDQTRDDVVKMWNKEIGQWIEANGFEATGFGV